MMRSMRMFFLVLNFNQLSVSAASTQPAHHWCGQEIYQFCRDAQTMPERLRCLNRNKKRPGFSSDCRKKIQKARSQVKNILESCHHDLNRFCRNQMESYGSASRCLLLHKPSLSGSCHAHLPEINHYALRTLVWNSCRPQILSLCYQETTEKGVSACLKNHLNALSFGCQKAGERAGLWEKPRLARIKSQNPKSQIQSLEP